MRCHGCDFQNEPGTQYCVDCGARLGVPCVGCGSANSAGAKFCGHCGADLRKGPAVPTVEARETASSGEETETPGTHGDPSGAERRQLTVMFCDVAGSTALSRRLDPEDLRDVFRACQSTCAEVIERFDGKVVQYLGDGLLVYFGHPQAHEDDPVRAGHAALEILEAMEGLNDRLGQEHDVRLGLRVGIHTGPAVVGQIGAGPSMEELAVGETPNLAAHIQAEAEAGTVLISDATHRLVRGFFTFEDQGPVKVKGFEDPVHLYRLVAPSGARGRLDAMATELFPLVGRRAELEELLARWELADHGTSGTVLIQGEAGIGKSRLVGALKERVARAHTVLESGCLAYHSNTALFPITDLLEREWGLGPGVDAEERLARLERLLADSPDPEGIPLLAHLLSIPLGDRHAPAALSTELQRRRTFELLLTLLERAASERPVLWIVEDLHWVDPSTKELLAMWTQRERPARVLTVLTSRPESAPSFGSGAVAEIHLDRLAQGQAERIITAVTGGKPLPEPLVNRIISSTDGVPLFVEEMTRTVIESGHLDETPLGYELRGPLPKSAVPLTLLDALTARLDRLGKSKSLVQMGAVIGREFSVALLEAVSPENGATRWESSLKPAVEAGILVRSESTQPAFRFRHTLVQDTAYQSLLKKTRERHHLRIFEVLESDFPEFVAMHPELLAHHSTEAGAVEKAVPYWLAAGRRGIAHAAFQEAIHHLEAGLQLLRTLPEGSDRDQAELQFQTALAVALQASEGYSAPRVEQVHARAHDLCRKGGDAYELVPVLIGQHLFYNVRADYDTADGIITQILQLAETSGDPQHQLEGCVARAVHRLYVGDLPDSKQWFEKAISLGERLGTPPADIGFLGNSAAQAYSYFARTLWIMGEADRAMECSVKSVGLAKTMAIPMISAQALGMHTLLHLARRENEAAHRFAAQTLAYSVEHGLPYWASLSAMCQAWLIAQEGRPQEGIERFQRHLDGYVATGARLGLSWFHLVLGEMYGRGGDAGRAFEQLDRAIEHVRSTGERYYEPEIHRLRGDLGLSLRGDTPEAATESFERALVVAREQGAVSWELRAATSLARLLRDTGRGPEARATLSRTYGLLSEGFDTPDVVDARKLLEELNRSP